MTNRLKWDLSIPVSRTTAPALPGDPLIKARLVSAVGRAAFATGAAERDAMSLLYAATRERTRELREDGRRAEEALMALKREVASYTIGIDADPARVASLVQNVIRWCVAAYYDAN
jgi:hypothetical protein